MFFSETCPPCKMLRPVLEQMQDEYDVHFLNVSKNMSLVRKYEVRSVPTVYVFQNGEELGGFRGYVTKSKIESIVTSLTDTKDF